MCVVQTKGIENDTVIVLLLNCLIYVSGGYRGGYGGGGGAGGGGYGPRFNGPQSLMGTTPRVCIALVESYFI